MVLRYQVISRSVVALVLAATVPAMLVARQGAPRQAQQRPATPPSKWQLNKITDPMSDAVSYTAVRTSDDGTASLRVHCADDHAFNVLITIPKTARLETYTIAEIRFDKEESEAYLVQAVTVGGLITSLGGSKTDTNYALAASGAETIAQAMHGGSLPRSVRAAAGNAFVAKLLKATRVTFRMTLLDEGTQGAFMVAGLTAVGKPVMDSCSG